MLSGLRFEVAGGTTSHAPNRADVACFIGYVGRRTEAAVPDAVQDQLRTAGWVGGPWDVAPERIDDLLHVPVQLDSFEAFHRLFAWERRVLRQGGDQRCSSYLGAAVRSFFAHGGRRAIVIRAGDPWSYVGGPVRGGRREARLGMLTPARGDDPRPFDPTNPATWLGIEHLYGLPDVSLVVLPDLADACASEPVALPVARSQAPPPAVFVECSEEEPPEQGDEGLRSVSAPRLNEAGFEAWARAVDAARGFLALHRRDALLVAALPLPETRARAGAHGPYAQADWLTFLRQARVMEAEGVNEAGNGTAASAFVQLAWPWLRTTRSDDLPERLEPACGLLAGVIAENALARGTFRSVAGTRLPAVVRPEPMPDLGEGGDSASARLAERVCLIGPEPDGVAVLSDVTSSPSPAWRPGGVSRLMTVLLRAARRVGEAEMFDANGPELWARTRRSLESLLDGFQRAGALNAGGREPAYEVRCDRSTMSQTDLDNGRLRAEITVRPAAALERITVSLELTAGGAESLVREVA